MSNHENLLKLNEWCKGTGALHVWVSFYPDNKEFWCIRVLTNGRGKSAPLRTCHGDDLENLAAEILPKAQATFEQQKAKIIREADEAKKRHARQIREDFREIEAMHRTASDY